MKKKRQGIATRSHVDFPAVNDCTMKRSADIMYGGGNTVSAVRLVPGDASSVFRRDAEAFSGAPGSTGGAPACIDLSVLLL